MRISALCNGVTMYTQSTITAFKPATSQAVPQLPFMRCWRLGGEIILLVSRKSHLGRIPVGLSVPRRATNLFPTKNPIQRPSMSFGAADDVSEFTNMDERLELSRKLYLHNSMTRSKEIFTAREGAERCERLHFDSSRTLVFL